MFNRGSTGGRVFLSINQPYRSLLWIFGSLICLILAASKGMPELSLSWLPQLELSSAEPIAQIIESLATTLAILAALWWFLIRGERSQRANIGHEVTFVDLNKDIVYVGVAVTIKNTGKVAVKPEVREPIASVVTIEELAPYLATVQESQIYSPEYKLRFLGQRTFPKGIRVEPGEQQTILFEFIIVSSITSIKVYSHVDNNGADGIGWDHTTIHEVKHGGR